VERHKISILFLKLPESIFRKPFEEQENQLLPWIFKNSNNLEESLTLALFRKILTKLEEESNGPLLLIKLRSLLKKTIYTVD